MELLGIEAVKKIIVVTEVCFQPFFSGSVFFTNVVFVSS